MGKVTLAAHGGGEVVKGWVGDGWDGEGVMGIGLGGVGGMGWSAGVKAGLLSGLGLGSTHFLRQVVRPNRVLTAVAICGISEGEEMEDTGANLLLVGPSTPPPI